MTHPIKQWFAMLCLAGVLSGCNEQETGFQGYVEGDYVFIAAPQAGWLRSVAVAEGVPVATGAPLFTLDAVNEQAALDEAQARLAQAQAELADQQLGSRPDEIASLQAQLAEAESAALLADKERTRQENLAKTNVASQAQLDQARANTAQANARVARMRAELATAHLPARSNRIVAAEAGVVAARAVVAQAEWHLQQRRIVSPMDATVDNLVRQPGEWVPANSVVLSLLPPEAVKLVFFVPEPLRAGLALGATLAVRCDGCAAGLSAHITRVATEAEYTPPVIYSQQTRAKLVYRIEASPQNGASGLHPGQPVTVERSP
jgi:HlyD family secretion protein